MAISRFSNLADVRAQLLDNLDFDSACGDLTKADAFIEAGRAWLILAPKRAVHGGSGGEEFTLSVEQIKAMIDDASDFRASQEIVINQRTNGGLHAFDLSEFRG